MRQYRRRNYKAGKDFYSKSTNGTIRKEQQYLGCTDEIDAYAFNIACDLTEKFSNKKSQLEALRTGDWFCMNYLAYESAFGIDHPVIDKLKKKIEYYLPKAKLGKPFLTKTWINY